LIVNLDNVYCIARFNIATPFIRTRDRKMFKNFRDKIALSGVTVLVIGIALLIFTFLSAYGFLTQDLVDLGQSGGIEAIFGRAMAPLIATSIRIMYLGIMGWISSLVTIRGVTIITNAPKLEAIVPVPQPVPQKPAIAQPQPKPAPQKAKTEPPKETKPPEAKPPEPEIVVIPPEEIAQPQQQQTNSAAPQSNS
jgi:hypothetical protein